MKSVRSLFEKNFVKIFEEKGYHYSYLGANNFKMVSNDGMTSACFDVPKLMPHCMRVMLSQWYRNQWRQFSLSEFCLGSTMWNEVYFHPSEEEFLRVVDTLAADALSCLSLLEQNQKMLVAPKDCYYMELSGQTSEKAREFAQKNHVELSVTELTPWAEQWLQNSYIAQKTFSSMSEALENDLPLFLSFCAYCGEVFRKEKGGIWIWYQDEQNKGYVVLWREGGIDVLGALTEYLSYCSVLQNLRLF